MTDQMPYPSNCTRDEYFMGLALDEARKAAAMGEVPVGAVVVHQNLVAGAGFNRRESAKNALAHAELAAIHAACGTLGGWRLQDCELYVTLEPCPMCTGAIINSRITRVIYGTADERFGCCGSLTDLTLLPFNHRPAITAGIRREECAALLHDFFAELRRRPKKRWVKDGSEPHATVTLPHFGAPADGDCTAGTQTLNARILPDDGRQGPDDTAQGNAKTDGAVQVAAAFIEDHAGRFLICRRGENKSRPLLWEFAGGKVESGETPAQALCREIWEELRLDICPSTLLGQVTYRYPDITIGLSLLRAEITGGSPTLTEHSALAWITPLEAAQYPFCAADRLLLNQLGYLA